MNCPEARAALPEFVYGGLAPDARAAVERHLDGCPGCRRESEVLRQVRRLLAAAPVPEVRVDTAAVYREAAARQARRLRLWRRAAVAACAAAVLLAALVGLSHLEVRVSASELVLRWGPPPAAPVPSPPPQPPQAAPPVPPPPAVSPADLAAVEDRLKVLGELTQALADDGHERDYQRQQEIARLREQLSRWQGLSAERLSAMEKDFDALYVAQFPSRKGVNP